MLFADFVTLAADSLVEASILFLAAAGLSLMFAAARLLSAAQGALFLVGAYGAVAVAAAPSVFAPAAAVSAALWLAAPAAAAGVIGLALARVALRPPTPRSDVAAFLASLALLLILQNLAALLFGGSALGVARPAASLGGAVFGGVLYADYELAAVGSAALAGAALLATPWGARLGAALRRPGAPERLRALAPRLAAFTLVVGGALAGLGGALAAARAPVHPALAVETTALVLAVVLIGGLGSVRGAALGACLVGGLRTLGEGYAPAMEIALVAGFAALALAFRPRGVFGAPAPDQRVALALWPPLARAPFRSPRSARLGVTAATALGFAALAGLGWAGPAWLVSPLTMVLASALAAAGLTVLARRGAVSLCQGAFAGLGAYAVAWIAAGTGAWSWAWTWPFGAERGDAALDAALDADLKAALGAEALAVVSGAPWQGAREAALLLGAAALVAGLGAAALGIAAARLRGAAFAALTLAVAVGVWSVAERLPAAPPPAAAPSPTALGLDALRLLCVAAAAVCAVAALWTIWPRRRVAAASSAEIFGAFVAAAVLAGLAGGLMALSAPPPTPFQAPPAAPGGASWIYAPPPLRGVDLDWTISVEIVVIALVGGGGLGLIAAAAALEALRAAAPPELWEAALGAALLLSVALRRRGTLSLSRRGAAMLRRRARRRGAVDLPANAEARSAQPARSGGRLAAQPPRA